MPIRHESNEALPAEIVREKAYVAYINCVSLTEAAVRSGISTGTLKSWAEQGNWEGDRDKHYKEVHKRVQFRLAQLVEGKAGLAVEIVNEIMDMMKTDLHDAELGTRKEVAESMLILAETMQKVMGLDDSRANAGPSLDININLDRDSAKVYDDVIDMFNDDENTNSDLEGDLAESAS